MLKRARFAKALVAALTAAMVLGLCQVAAGAEQVERFLLGWPWSQEARLESAEDEGQPSIVAYQLRGPEMALVDGGGQFADAATPGGGGAVAGGAGNGVPASGLLTGNLTPRSAASILIEAGSGQVLYAKNEHDRRAIASVTKIMTLSLIFDAIQTGKVQLTDMIGVSQNASGMGGSQIWLEPGEQLSLRDMLVAIAVGSANDACVAVAEHLYGTHERFVQAMNEKAAALGMADTHYVNSYGLDAPDHYSSAADIARLARYAVSCPRLLEFTSIWLEYLRDGKTMQANANKLVRYYSGCDGLKTGLTDEAGYCVCATAARDGTRMIAVILGAPDSNTRFNEARGLLNAGFSSFESVPLARRGETAAKVLIERGTKAPISLVVPEDFGIVVPKGEKPDITRRVVREERIFAPVRKGQQLAELVIEGNGKELGRCPLVADADVPRATLLRLAWKALSMLFGGEKTVR
jgi:D-alanyl-D-alanine carboxypeptidase (penicillin-binding protein 5/6)